MASRFDECPCNEETPDPCPKCGATVSGNDPVHGVCQAGATWDRATTAERERCAQLVEQYVCSTGHLAALVDQIRNPDQQAESRRV